MSCIIRTISLPISPGISCPSLANFTGLPKPPTHHLHDTGKRQHAAPSLSGLDKCSNRLKGKSYCSCQSISKKPPQADPTHILCLGPLPMADFIVANLSHSFIDQRQKSRQQISPLKVPTLVDRENESDFESIQKGIVEFCLVVMLCRPDSRGQGTVDVCAVVRFHDKVLHFLFRWRRMFLQTRTQIVMERMATIDDHVDGDARREVTWSALRNHSRSSGNGWQAFPIWWRGTCIRVCLFHSVSVICRLRWGFIRTRPFGDFFQFQQIAVETC